ncbi:ADP-ribosylglycohydrolase-domain-containing protein [Mycena sp. CBHHK59/15]|nr:ADP-ribosylglycohydrolase-domain-containing protein [Mycena sp. CBHHK59/15]
MDAPKTLDKAVGALIGLALGDAIGIYTEFMTAPQAQEAYGSGSPIFSLVPPETKLHHDTHRCVPFRNCKLTLCWSFSCLYHSIQRAWTDDTDHTILMVLSYLRLRELSPDDFAIRLHSWCQQGLRVLDRLPMGLGKTVGSVVFSPEYKKDPTGTALRYWEKNRREIAPNGSLMRTTPVGVICISKTEEETFEAAIRMGAVTHADPRCAVSVAIVSALVRAMCRGEVQEAEQLHPVLDRAWAYVVRTQPDCSLDLAEFERHAYAETLDELVLCDRTMGYVYKCLGSALWCLRQVLTRQETFRSAMTALVMQGGDADTNGAVAGALMGALYGYTLLPKEWRDGMRHEEWYHAKIVALCSVAGLRDTFYDSENDSDTKMDGGKGFLSEDEMKKREMQIMEKMLLSEKERREAAVVKVKNAQAKTSWRSWLT